MTKIDTTLVSWMRKDALDYWAEHGVDRKDGGYIEERSPEGGPSNVAYKRVRVQGRQLFAFASAALLGWRRDAAEIAEHGYRFLRRAAWQPEGRYWVSRLSRTGDVIDSTMDLYDMAFVVLGLATYYRLTRNKEALDLIHTTADTVRARLAIPGHPGYRQSPADTAALRQNPNMHWFESMLFCFEATQDQRFRDEAKSIYDLAVQRIIAPDSGALRELFDNDWKAVPENGKILVEPGHHYEWAWLLDRAKKSGIGVAPELIGKLLSFADRHGVNPATGLIYDQVTDGGAPTLATHRLWPQTEAIKAWLIRTDKPEAERAARINQLQTATKCGYFDRLPPGSWHDRLDAQGHVQPGNVPASSMYHVMMCVMELWAHATEAQKTPQAQQQAAG